MQPIETLSACLSGLSDALMRFDEAQVERFTAELDGLRQHLTADALSGTDTALLLYRIRQASSLASGAAKLCSGHLREVAPTGSAYTPGGAHPSVTESGSVRLDL